MDDRYHIGSSDPEIQALEERWENKEPDPSSVINEDEAVEMGLLHQETEESDTDERLYEKLGKKDTAVDVAKSVGVEALHILQNRNSETQYQSRTHFGENMKNIYREFAGTAALMAAAALAAPLTAGGSLAAGAAAGTKFIGLLNGIRKAMSGADIINKASKTTKLGKIAANTVNFGFSGALSDVIANFFTFRPEDNKETAFIPIDDNDSELKMRLKKSADNLLSGAAFGGAMGSIGEAAGLGKVVGRFLDKINIFKKSKTKEEALQNFIDAARAKTAMDEYTSTADVINQVNTLYNRSLETGEEISELIQENVHPKRIKEAMDMAKLKSEGEDIIPMTDGTWSVRVTNWEDAYKVTPEQYKEQLFERDEINGGISDMNKAVRHTWINRGWIGENEQLTSKNASKIVKNYTDKWGLDNNVKVEIVDGLTVKGQKVDGNTQATVYKGKSVKSKKNAIDKKKLQITELKDKITQLEGGNGEVSDPLTNLKEELKIAENELKELEQANLKTDRIPDITIKIDKNAKDPFAALRSELEHARDIAKGTVPNQKKQHFSRYRGLNEAEMSPDYTHKKSTGRAKAVELEQYKDYISVYINDVETENFTWNTSTQIVVSDDLSSGDVVSIRRTTPIDEELVEFSNSSILDEETLNTAQDQVFHAVQEIYDNQTTYQTDIDSTISY